MKGKFSGGDKRVEDRIGNSGKDLLPEFEASRDGITILSDSKEGTQVQAETLTQTYHQETPTG